MSIMFGQYYESAGVQADEAVVRHNSTPVSNDTPPAEAQGAPEWNEREFDSNPLLGLDTRQVASDWHESEQSVPHWQSRVDSNSGHAEVINRQVSSSGTAAQREASGQHGPGSMAYAVGIEPTIRDGAAFGNDYFVTAPSEGANPTTDFERGVQPARDQSREDIGAAAYYGAQGSRDAAAAGLYSAWYSANGGS